MKKLTFWIKRMFANRRIAIAFSLIVAFIAWLVISLDQNPVREATFSNVAVSIDVSASAAGDMGLDIVTEDYLTSTNVTVQGPNYIVSSLKSSDISVFADLSDVTGAGTYVIPLKAQRLNGTSGYSVISVNPGTIKLTFDYIDTREFPVLVKADGINASAGLIVDEAVVSSTGEANLVIKGSKTNLDLIGSVVALVNEKETIDATKTYDADILVYDSNGSMLNTSGFTLSAQKVKVTVPVCKKKVLPVTPTFINEPVSNLGSSLVSNLSVDSVTLIGPPAVIDELQFVELSKIDFSQISTNKRSFDVSFSLPDGVRVLDNVSFVTVNLSLKGYTTKNFNVSKENITFKNVASGCTATPNTDIKNVVVCGLSTTLANIKSEDLFVEIDLAGKSAGEYTVTAIVKNKNNLAVWQVGSSTITVTIK